MLVVTIELWPGGRKELKRHLGTAKIVNDLRGSLESQGSLGDYEITLSKWGRPDSVWKRTALTGFRRKTRGPWDLLYLALKAAVGSRND